MSGRQQPSLPMGSPRTHRHIFGHPPVVTIKERLNLPGAFPIGERACSIDKHPAWSDERRGEIQNSRLLSNQPVQSRRR